MASIRNSVLIPHKAATIIPTYSINKIDVKELTLKEKPTQTDMSVAQKDIAYLKHDMVTITAASGIIVGIDLLLFVLLTTGGLHLGFLGY